MFLLGCAPSSTTYVKPMSNHGEITIDGCDTVPRTFRHESNDDTYKIKSFFQEQTLTITLEVVSLKGKEVVWENNNIRASINGIDFDLVVEPLRVIYSPGACGGLTEVLNCKVYNNYYSVVKINNIKSISDVLLYPPVPLIDDKPIKIEPIQFKQVTETVWHPLNC
jgi:hypothetical protein